MPTLNGTGVNPGIVKDKLGQAQVEDRGKADEITELSDRLTFWRAYQKTDAHKVVTDLADPYMIHLRENIEKSITELRLSYPQLLNEDLVELRAEWRGELRWWKMIMLGPDLMERRLKELEEFEEKKTEEGSKEKALPHQIEKYT